ncbi:hypothetical protein COV16_01980 [Candidatus Woesearchaeota archaeon CG10_big_fil_rev_8_21_14_0_10_34_8]|nr:MAG: hypothetical protein COV16_01980 [Candidatus Woesearchaeota archaeon CG10_big_fil_rev_8_21_14_0_10_34_8]
MITQTKNNIRETPKKIKADNGYNSQLKKASEMFPEIDLYIDDKNRRKEDINLGEIKKKYSDIEYNNLTKLLSPEGEMEYKKRMYTVEPVFGNIKENLGYRGFLLRGLKKVKGEFNLMCIAHNINKIYNFIKKQKMKLAVALKNIKDEMKIKRNCQLDIN